jgi:hypothetical protein
MCVIPTGDRVSEGDADVQVNMIARVEVDCREVIWELNDLYVVSMVIDDVGSDTSPSEVFSDYFIPVCQLLFVQWDSNRQ